jgi:hypothetical protein
MESLKMVAFVLGSALLLGACDPGKTQFPTLKKRQTPAVSQRDSHPVTGRRRGKRNKSSPPQDPEDRRVRERARRWMEEQKKRQLPPVVPLTNSSVIA